MAHSDDAEPLGDPARLAALRRRALPHTSNDEAFDRLARLASRALGAPIALVTLVEPDRQVFAGFVGLPEPWASWRQTPLSYSFCQHVVASGELLLVADAREHPLLRANRAVAELGAVAYAGVPLISSEGHVLGAFCGLDTRPHTWTAEEVATLHDLAALAMAELDRRVVSIEQVRQQQRRDGLLAVARRLSAEPQPERVLRALVEAGVSLLGMDDGGVARWDPAQQALLQVESFLPSASAGTRLDLTRSASGRAAVERRVVVVTDYQRLVGQTTPAGRAGAQLVVALPLQHEGRLLGTLSVSSFAPNSSLADDDATVLEMLASLAAAVLVGQERARLAGALLAAFTAQHELANALSAVSGSVQLLRRTPDLPASVRERADVAVRQANYAAARLQQLQELIGVVEMDWGRAGRTIDLDRSI